MGIDEIRERANSLVARLVSRLNSGFDDDTAAQLALLRISPFEEDEEPLGLSEAVLARNPLHGLANLVHAYLSLHYLMDDDAMSRSVARLETLVDNGIEVGAAYLQLAELRQMLDLDSDLASTAHLVRASIAAEPSWTQNHLQLAWALREAGQFEEARGEYDLAIAHRLSANAVLSPLEWSYADCFTGQLISRTYLEEERDALARPSGAE